LSLSYRDAVGPGVVLRAGDHCRETNAKGNGDLGSNLGGVYGQDEPHNSDIFGCVPCFAR
jgi:hypothetical protein